MKYCISLILALLCLPYTYGTPAKKETAIVAKAAQRKACNCHKAKGKKPKCSCTKNKHCNNVCKCDASCFCKQTA